MLQQTRVVTVIPYYKHFLKRFPTLEALSEAPEQDLLECWSGLGYYRRARMMQITARKIVSEYGGRFPKNFEKLQSLPGIGTYTAAAVASIAFELPFAAVDGNVVRVLTRLDDDARDITGLRVRQDLLERAQQLIESCGPQNRGTFNQAMMELGSLLCTNRKPQCSICPIAIHCTAHKKGLQEQRPVRHKRRRPAQLQLAVALVKRGEKILLGQRQNNNTVMPGFWELPEVQGPQLAANCFNCLGIRRQQLLATFRHRITFREYRGSLYRGKLAAQKPRSYFWVSPERLQKLPLTTITRKALAAARELGGESPVTSSRSSKSTNHVDPQPIEP